VATWVWVLIGLGLFNVIGNVLLTGPLWTSPGLDGLEKTKLTLLMWLVPASVLYVGQVVQDSWAGDPRGGVPNPLLHSGNTDSEVLARSRGTYDDDGPDFDFYD
jgi:hypothetical protein